MEALRTLRAVPGVIAPVRLSLILLACGGTRYTQTSTVALVLVYTPRCSGTENRVYSLVKRRAGEEG